MRWFALATALLLAATAVACGGGSSKAKPAATLPQPSPTAVATAVPSQEPGLSSYANPVFKLELQYPAGWVPDPQYAANIGGGVDEMYRDAGGRQNGFFQVGAVTEEGRSLDAVAEGEVNHLLRPSASTRRSNRSR